MLQEYKQLSFVVPVSAMSLRVTVHDGKEYVCGDDVAAGIACDAHAFRVDVLLDQIPAKLDTLEDASGATWIRRRDVHALMNWYAPDAPAAHLPRIGGLLRGLKIDKAAKRAVARKHRWEIAHSQKYCCADCAELLHPKAFEIDHKTELRDGGQDVLSNLQALCSLCHAKKTRTRDA